MACTLPDLISPVTRRAFRDLANALPYQRVADLWEDERFFPDSPILDMSAGVRRRVYESYARTVNWANADEVARALRVFEGILGLYQRHHHYEPTDLDQVREALAEDGLRLNDRAKIHWEHPPHLAPSLAQLSDPSGILAELERVRRSLPADPAAAIGSAKQLIEATAKVVLHERGLPVNDKADVPALIRDAQQALGLHPSSIVRGPDDAEAVKKILGGVSAIAIGVAELRNRGFGTGHGQLRTPAGLGVRHAHLAVNASITWCQIMLDTLVDPTAPWRTPSAPPDAGAVSEAAARP
jgi:abortive infection Abi-like protein